MAPTMVLLPAPLGPTTRFSFVPGYTVLSSYDKKFFILRMMQCARTHQRRTRISSAQLQRAAPASVMADAAPDAAATARAAVRGAHLMRLM
jgi:hypothetical protein